VAIRPPAPTPEFQWWAEVYYEDARRRGLNLERIGYLVSSVLQFFGLKPEDPEKTCPDAPYHNLRLGDLVDDPSWFLKWEAWLAAPKRDPIDKTGPRTRLWSGQTKNQRRSTLSQFYELAMKPAYRGVTGITTNPCTGIDRDRRVGRRAVLSREDILAVVAQGSYHLRLAIALALLTPKLRESDILKLEFDRDFSEDFRWLTVHGHKTERATGQPLVAHVPEQLREILRDAKRRAGRRQRVITYQRQPIAELRGAVRGAVERAAKTRPHLVYGRATDQGITFHTLRHSAATLLAELAVPLQQHQKMLGHRRIETTLLYTHLRPTAEIAPSEQLSQALPLKDLVTAPRSRPPRRVGDPVGTATVPTSKTPAKRRALSKPTRVPIES
jgi:integrase